MLITQLAQTAKLFTSKNGLREARNLLLVQQRVPSYCLVL